MSLHKNRPPHQTSKPKALRTPLKKLPSKKAKPSKQDLHNNINIDVRAGRKDFESIIELAKRKLTNSPSAKMPSNLKPMLATLVDEPFNDEEWQFELKLDGYRTLAYIKNGKADIRSRNNNSFNKKFESVYQALTQWKINAIVDGEIVVLNDEGVPDFNGIQLWDKKKEGLLVYYVFDLLWLDGLDIMQ